MKRVLLLALLLGGCGESDQPVISQAGKRFDPGAIELRVGQSVVLMNDDARTHNIRVNDPAFKFDSGAQEPGERVELSFPDPGRYYVVCGIHPTMKLVVDVKAEPTE